MVRRVVVIASGETERRALPHLARNLSAVAVIEDVRIPPNGRLTGEMAGRLVRATWFARAHSPPDAFVVLVDADNRPPADAIAEVEPALRRTTTDLPVHLSVTAAKWHLEAWFFGDEAGLRAWLGRPLGDVDCTQELSKKGRPMEMDAPARSS